jgi:hypothetical protein
MTMTSMPGTTPSGPGAEPGRRSGGMRIARFSVRLAALRTVGHALVIGDDGSVVGVLTPADLARARQVGALYLDQRTL